MIPKVIHYCWFGNNPLPKSVEKFIKTWEKYCPDYKIIRWDESNFDINCCSFVKEAYSQKYWAFVSDYARLKIIYDNGGIYLDTDVELIKNLDFLLENKGFLAVQQGGNYIATGLGFGAEKHNYMIKEMLDLYSNIKFDYTKLNELQCPKLNTSVFLRYGYKASDEIQTIKGINIYPSKYFDPYSTGNSKDLMCSETISIHHYSASWTKSSIKLKRRFMIFIGLKNIQRIKRFLR